MLAAERSTDLTLTEHELLELLRAIAKDMEEVG